MNEDHIGRLLRRLNAGEASPEEIVEIETMLEAGTIAIDDLSGIDELRGQVADLNLPLPSEALDRRFYDMLARQKGEGRTLSAARQTSFIARIIGWYGSAPKLAMACAMLVVGIAVGYLLRPQSETSGNTQIAALSHQVSELQEMMMLSLLEKGSATDRLKAVGLTQQMDDASKKVTNALIHTLNHDENINVRLAALDALKAYADDGGVREALVRSIAHQESPLVQVSLAELMVALQEKAAAKELERIVASDKTPGPVKKKLRESIDVLI